MNLPHNMKLVHGETRLDLGLPGYMLGCDSSFPFKTSEDPIYSLISVSLPVQTYHRGSPKHCVFPSPTIPCDENPQWPSNSIYIWISMRNPPWYGSANSPKYWKNGLLLDVKLGRYGFMVWGGTYCYKTTINLSFAAQVIALLCR